MGTATHLVAGLASDVGWNTHETTPAEESTAEESTAADVNLNGAGIVDDAKSSIADGPEDTVVEVEEADGPPTSPSWISFTSDTSVAERSQKPKKSISHKSSAKREARLKQALAAREAANTRDDEAEGKDDGSSPKVDATKANEDGKEEPPSGLVTAEQAQADPSEEPAGAQDSVDDALSEPDDVNEGQLGTTDEPAAQEASTTDAQALAVDDENGTDDQPAGDTVTADERKDKDATMAEDDWANEEVKAEDDAAEAPEMPADELVDEASTDDSTPVDEEEAGPEEAHEEPPADEAPAEEAPTEEALTDKAPAEEAPPGEGMIASEETTAAEEAKPTEITPAAAETSMAVESTPLSPTSSRVQKPEAWTRPVRHASVKRDRGRKDKSRQSNKDHVPLAGKLAVLATEMGPEERLEKVTKWGLVRRREPEGTAFEGTDSEESTELVYVRVPRSRGTRHRHDSATAEASRQQAPPSSGTEIHRRRKPHHRRHYSSSDGGFLSKHSSPEDQEVQRVSSHHSTGSRHHHRSRHGSMSHAPAAAPEEGRSSKHGSRRGSRDDGGQVPLAKKIVTGLVKGMEKAFMPAEIRGYSKPPPSRSAPKSTTSGSKKSKK